MIELYTGVPGSGKSLHCAALILRQFKRGLPVIANFMLDLSNTTAVSEHLFSFCSNASLTPEYLASFSSCYFADKKIKEDEILLIVDEAQIVFSCRDWSRPDRSRWIEFFSQHRKLGFRVVLICQFRDMIDKQIRNLVEYETIHRKANNCFAFTEALARVFPSCTFFVAITVWLGMRKTVSRSIFRYHSKYANIYDSYSLFTASGGS